MPSVSKTQHNFMEAAAHDKKFAAKAGVPQQVATEFIKADSLKDLKSLPYKSKKKKRRYH